MPLNLSSQKLSTTLKSSLTKVSAIASICLASTFSAHAADWSSTNIQLLNGSGFELGDKDRTIFTFENALGWKYGDSFLFIDVTEPFSEGTSYYSEFSPRFSLGKITGKDMSFGIVKDVMVSTTLEMGEETRGYLVGVGLPLDIPGFAFANVNLYARQSDRDFAADDTDLGGQVTLTWNRPFTLGSTKWNFEGFFDYAFAEKGGSAPKEDNIVAAPRLMLNLGKSLQVGIEQQIWRNKFGVKNVDEDVTQAMVKFTF